MLGYETAYASKSKPGWGMEESLLCLQPNKVSVYLRARNGVGLEGHTDESGACKKCGTHVQWAMHLMIECQGTQISVTGLTQRQEGQTRDWGRWCVRWG